jgi:hypothetical protein
VTPEGPDNRPLVLSLLSGEAFTWIKHLFCILFKYYLEVWWFQAKWRTGDGWDAKTRASITLINVDDPCRGVFGWERVLIRQTNSLLVEDESAAATNTNFGTLPRMQQYMICIHSYSSCSTSPSPTSSIDTSTSHLLQNWCFVFAVSVTGL